MALKYLKRRCLPGRTVVCLSFTQRREMIWETQRRVGVTGPARSGVTYWGHRLARRVARDPRLRGERQRQLLPGSAPAAPASLNCSFWPPEHIQGCKIFLGIYL